MKQLFSMGAPIPFGRVVREHRAALLPLGIALVLNLVVLIAVVLPLSQRVATNEARAQAAERERVAASVDFKRAESSRESRSKASTDLETFYTKILPVDGGVARRQTHLRLQQKAREHGVRYQRGALDEQRTRESNLQRLVTQLTLTGNYDDIRALIYDLEMSPEFVVIDQMQLSEGETDASLALALEMSTYYRVAPANETRTRQNGR